MKKVLINNRIITCIIIFFVISLISIFTAQKITSSIGNIFIRQIIFYVIGIIMLLISYFKKKEIIKYSLWLYLFFNILLVILLFMGISINGSRCWLIIGPFSFQPSEFMKIFLIILNAKVLCKFRSKKNMKKEFKMLLIVFILVLIPSILTFLEPDTGVVIIYFIITISMIIYRGINKKWYLGVLVFLFIFINGIGYLYFYQHNLLINILGSSLFYRIERIINWSSQSGYQLENSLIAIGSSGLVGFGFNKTPLYFPEASTDFIFATFSSNFGFLGSFFLIILIIIFDSTILSICNKKVKKIDQYLLVGFFAMIFYQQIQNICMTIGLLPITGITLPFISYGGSSLLSYMFMIGLILKISHDNYKYIN